MHTDDIILIYQGSCYTSATSNQDIYHLFVVDHNNDHDNDDHDNDDDNDHDDDDDDDDNDDDDVFPDGWICVFANCNIHVCVFNK